MRRDEQKLQAYFSECPEDIALSDIDFAHMPSHVSMIMDGNGRWATRRGLDRAQGHVAGVNALREAVTTGVRLGFDVLSAYAFSTENWRRPKIEVDLLMGLFAKTLVAELPLFHQENVHLEFFGDLDALPKDTRRVFMRGLDETAQHDGMVFALAVNYGARDEIVRAATRIARAVQAGKLDPDDITHEVFASHLYTANLPDPDLLIRTSGEQRLSNYFLYQLAYTELYITQTLWPDFSRWDMLRAIRSFQSRSRRFGGV